MGLKTLRKRISNIVSWVEGTIGVSIQEVDTGEEIGIRESEPFPMASVCKTPILVDAYRKAEARAFCLDKRIEFTADMRTPGSGLLNYFDDGLRPTLRDLLLLMIVVSDNAATDLVLSQIGGPDAITTTMHALGLPGIRMHRSIRDLLDDIAAEIEPKMRGLDYYARRDILASNPNVAATFEDVEKVRTGIRAACQDRDHATPRDMARLYAQIARNECADEQSCAAILQTLERQQLRGRLPRELPPTVRFCHKTGTLGPGTVTNDTGLMFIGDRAVAVAVMSRDIRQDQATVNSAFSRIGQAMYEYFSA